MGLKLKSFCFKETKNDKVVSIDKFSIGDFNLILGGNGQVQTYLLKTFLILKKIFEGSSIEIDPGEKLFYELGFEDEIGFFCVDLEISLGNVTVKCLDRSESEERTKEFLEFFKGFLFLKSAKEYDVNLRPSILFIDEVENGLHFDNLCKKIEDLKSVSNLHQVFITSHSPIVCRSVDVEDWLVAKKSELGYKFMKETDPHEKKKYFLDDNWDFYKHHFYYKNI